MLWCVITCEIKLSHYCGFHLLPWSVSTTQLLHLQWYKHTIQLLHWSTLLNCCSSLIIVLNCRSVCNTQLLQWSFLRGNRSGLYYSSIVVVNTTQLLLWAILFSCHSGLCYWAVTVVHTSYLLQWSILPSCRNGLGYSAVETVSTNQMSQCSILL